MNVIQSGIRWTRVETGAAVEYPEQAAQPSTDVARGVLAGIPDDGREHSIAVALDTHGRPLAWERVTSGTVDSCPLYPRDLYAWALSCPGVRFLGVAHNHPSGDTTPSGADVAGTRNVASVGAQLGVDLVWSLVVTHRNDTWAAIPITGKGGAEKPPPVPGGDDQGNPPPVPGEDEGEGEDEAGGGDEGEAEGEGEDGDEDEGKGEGEAGSGEHSAGGDLSTSHGATKEDLAAALERLVNGVK